MHENLGESVESDIAQRGQDRHVVESSEAGQLLQLFFLRHLLLGRGMVFLEVYERQILLPDVTDQFRHLVDRIVEMVRRKGDSDVLARIQFSEIPDRVGRRKHRVLVVLDRHGHAQFFGQLVVGPQFLEERLGLLPRLGTNRILLPHPAGTAHRHHPAVLFHPAQLVVLLEGPERIAGRDSEPGVVLLEQILEILVSFLLDLLTVSGVDLSPYVDRLATSVADLGDHVFDRHISVERGRKDIPQLKITLVSSGNHRKCSGRCEYATGFPAIHFAASSSSILIQGPT